MTHVCIYFQVHQPMRLRRIRAFDDLDGYEVWDDQKNRALLDRVAEKCYLPANQMILDLIEETNGRFRVAYSISGVLLEQAQQFRPELIESFQRLAETGCVEFLAETYYHSLSGLWDDPSEFHAQIEAHHALIEELFGQSPTVFRNTELIYDDRIAGIIDELGYEAILTEGTEQILGERPPTHVYQPAQPGNELKVLLKHYRLSDDVAFRFSAPDWSAGPLRADTYANWLANTPGDTINLFMDYETFGEHQWPETGIFQFLEHLPGEVGKHEGLDFALPSEVVAACTPRGTIEAPHAISWADTERDVSAWLHNKMQHECFQELKELAPLVEQANDPALRRAWRLLQTSDHLYYCTTKHLDDQTIHAYFSPYDSPYLAYINYRNALTALRERAKALAREPSKTLIPA